MEAITIKRYPSSNIAVSPLDRMRDALDLIAFLCSQQLVERQLINLHQKSAGEAKKLSGPITSHASLALKYAKLALQSPAEIAPLAGYYSVLNLAKVLILYSPYSAEISKHARWHGAVYRGTAKISRNLLTEEVTVKSGGALALFYKCLTGNPIQNDRTIRLRDIYQCVQGVSHEVHVADGGRSNILWLQPYYNQNSSTTEFEVHVITGLSGKPFQGTVRTIPPIRRNFRKKPGSQNIFQYSVANQSNQAGPEELFRDAIDCCFILHGAIENSAPREGFFTISQSSVFPLPEEFAAALIFFHLSSVCRYNPELLEKIKSSEFWPVVLAARRHLLYDFLLKSWSYVTDTNQYLKPH